MPQSALYIAITNHGFGHAARVASVAARIQQLCPAIQLILVTTAPRWLLASYLTGDFIHRPRAFDVGVVQTDSFAMDKTATLQRWQQIRAQQQTIIAEEVTFIKQHRVRLILADIPPLAALIAQQAQIPCWMMSNFGWDFIYQQWTGEFKQLSTWISDCYQQCNRLFRLPFHEEMRAFSTIIDVGLTGGIPRYDLAELRQKIGLRVPKEKTVLLTFGGLGLTQIPYQNLSQFPDWQFITLDQDAPCLPNLIKLPSGANSGQQALNTPFALRPVDFMPLCGRVVSKPGYSTFAEAVRLDVPIVSTSREDFAETAFLLKGLQNHAYHQLVTLEAFFTGNWSFLRDNLQPPQQSHTLAKNGSETIANEIIQYFQA